VLSVSANHPGMREELLIREAKEESVLQGCCLLNMLRQHPKSHKPTYSINCSCHPVCYLLPQGVVAFVLFLIYSKCGVQYAQLWIWENFS